MGRPKNVRLSGRRAEGIGACFARPLPLPSSVNGTTTEHANLEAMTVEELLTYALKERGQETLRRKNETVSSCGMALIPCIAEAHPASCVYVDSTSPSAFM
jgi:hypothetical protein